MDLIYIISLPNDHQDKASNSYNTDEFVVYILSSFFNKFSLPIFSSPLLIYLKIFTLLIYPDLPKKSVKLYLSRMMKIIQISKFQQPEILIKKNYLQIQIMIKIN